MKKIICSVLLAFLTLNSFAGPLDVKPKHKLNRGDLYVRVTKLANEKVKFEKCVSGYEKAGCDQIGNKKSYSLKELRDQRLQEQLQVGYSILGDVLAVVAFEATAIYASGVIGGAFAGGFWATAAGHAAAAVPATMMLPAIDLNVLNPLEQNRQAKTLKEEILTDKDVLIDSEDMRDFIDRLDMVLSKI